jgi:Ca-activated chloride channel homolog
MIFTAPLGLLALLAIPAIIVIHLLRRRFPVRPVAGLFLWRLSTDVPDGGRRLDRLPITRSLLLELLAALALALIIAGAQLSSSTDAEHLVVLLDDSASMGAGEPGGERVRDRAVRRVLDEVERIGPRGRITIVRSGERPAVLAGPASFSAEAAPALEGWTPGARHHSLAPGLRLARELAGDAGSVLVLTDTVPDGTADRLADGEQWAALGIALPNIAIVDAHRSRTAAENGSAIALTLRNYGDAATRVLRVTTGATEVLTRTIDVPPGVSSLTLPLPAGVPAVRATLSDDALAFDNSVVLVEPRPRVVGVANQLADGRGRVALDRAIDALPEVTRSSPAHLSFTDGDADAAAATPGAWTVRFGAPGVEGATPASGADYIGPFVIEKRHPLLQGVTLGGVVWTGARPFSAEAGRPLVSAGDVGLLAAPNDPAAQAFVFNLDLERTNLLRSPDWPILISNLVETRRRELPGPERWNYRVGEWIRIRLERPPAGPLRLRMDTVDRELPQARLTEFIAPAPGGLALVLDGEDVLFEIAINPLDEAEGDLRLSRTETLGALGPARANRSLESGAPFDPLFWILLAVAGAAMLGNWSLLAPGRVRA